MRGKDQQQLDVFSTSAPSSEFLTITLCAPFVS
jgi:hypothetical protein